MDNQYSFQSKPTMNEKISNIKSVLKKRPRVVLAIVVILALSLPFVIGQALQRQDLRQRASVAPAIDVTLNSSTTSLAVGQELEVIVKMKTLSNNIGSLSYKLTYDSAKLQLIEGAAGSPFTLMNKTTTSNTYAPLFLNITADPITSDAFVVYTFKFKGLQAGSAAVTLDTVKGTAQGQSTYVPVEFATRTTTFTVTATGPTTTVTTVPSTTVTTAPTVTVTTAPSTTVTSAPSTTVTTIPTAAPTVTAGPTATIAPTTTVGPNEITAIFKVQLPGIGNGTANLGLNATPQRPQRIATVQILNSQDVAITTGTGYLTYNSTTSTYEGRVNLGTFGVTITPGSYNAKVKFENTLFKAIPGVITITNTQFSNLSTLTAGLISGDLNNDNALGIIDWTYMIACIKNEAACTSQIRALADLNDNGQIDELDVQILQKGFALRDGD